MGTDGFGMALRRWRDRVTPGDVGLPSGGRRRAVGLRREEVSGLAGVSVDYLTRLEQGRATSPSAQVLEALARALRLSSSERELLFSLAGRSAPGPGSVPQRITASTQRLLDRLADVPVAVYDAMWNLIGMNQPYDALSGAWSWHGAERNGAWRTFVGPGPLADLDEAALAEQERELVADLRVTAAHYPHDPRVADLTRRLRGRSTRFADLWDAADLPGAGIHARHKTVLHPVVGPIALDCDTLVVAGDDLRVMVYTAEPGTGDADRLALAVLLGTRPAAARG